MLHFAQKRRPIDVFFLILRYMDSLQPLASSTSLTDEDASTGRTSEHFRRKCES